MIRKLLTALAATSIVFTGALASAAVANATEVTTQAGSESDHMPKSSRGSQNAEVDAMPTVRNDGNLEGEAVTGILRPHAYPLVDEFGAPILDANGKQKYGVKYVWEKIGSGVAPATIVKQY